MKGEIPEISSILTHIESEPNTVETGDEILREPSLEQKLRSIVKEFPEVIDMHDLELKKVRGLIYLSCHCTMSDELPLSQVHPYRTADRQQEVSEWSRPVRSGQTEKDLSGSPAADTQWWSILTDNGIPEQVRWSWCS
jgi:hypothetical protein